MEINSAGGQFTGGSMIHTRGTESCNEHFCDEQITGATPRARRSFYKRTGDYGSRGGGHERCPVATGRGLHENDRADGEAIVRRVRQSDQSDTKRRALRYLLLRRSRVSSAVDRRGVGRKRYTLPLCRRPSGAVGARRLAAGFIEARDESFARSFGQENFDRESRARRHTVALPRRRCGTSEFTIRFRAALSWEKTCRRQRSS